SDIHRILKSQRSVNRWEFLRKGAEIRDRLAPGEPQGKERGVRRHSAVAHPRGSGGRKRSGNWVDFIGIVAEAIAAQGLQSVKVVSTARAGRRGKTPKAVAGLL